MKNYIGTMMETEAPDLITEYELEPFDMKVQDLNRTLVDKVFALCDYFLQGKIARHSRHLYDIYMLLPHVTLDERFKALVKEVREDRKSSPVCLAAQDGVEVPELLRKIVDEDVYKSDYEGLTEQLLEETISYQHSLSALRKLIKSDVFV